jgi:hypothetical protein
MAWQPPEESFDDTKKSQWSPPEESFDDAKKPQWSPPEESFDDSLTKIEDVDKLKEIQSTGQKLTDKQQRILFKADDERSFLDKVSGAVGAFIPAAADIIGQTATGAVELANKAVVQPAAFALSGGYNRLDSEEAKKVFKEREETIRSLGVGAAKDIEETVNAAVRFGMFGSATTDKLLGKSDEERFRAWQNRQTMRQLEAQEVEQNPDRVAALLSQNPLIQGYVEYEAKKMGLSPKEVENVKQDYIQTMLDQGLTKDQINEQVATLGEFVSPVAIPGGGRLSKAVLKPLSKITAPVFNKATDLTARGISKVAGGTEFAANKVLQGTELLQTGARKIGEYTINDPDTWIKGTVNTAIMPVVGVAKPVSATARVIKDITKQVDVGGTAGRRGMFERAGQAVDSSDLTKKLFGAQGKGGVTRAKLADWTIRQSNALIQPGINAAALNVAMGLPDIETAEDLGFVSGTGFGIGSMAGTRSFERVGGLIDPRTTMAEKISNLVTPDPAAYRRDEDADIKRFMAQASPEIQQNITDVANIERRKAAVDATIANLEKSRDAQIDPEDVAFKQKQIDGFLKQKEALSKTTPETQAEALRQTQLAFIDAYDLAQSTGGVAGLRGVNIAVLDPNNADQFFRDLYGDSLRQAEATVNLLTGIPSLTETDSQKLTESRQLLQKFQNDVEGAKSARGFAIQEDNTDPNSTEFVPPHLRRINQQGATAVINADLIKHLSDQGFNIRHTLQHEVQHAVQQFGEVNKMLAPLRGQLFDQKIKNDDGTTEVYQQGIYSDEDLNRYAARYANLMSPNDNGASFYAQFGGDSEKMRAYIKDEILAETAAATGEYAGGTRASLDDVGRNVMDWLEVKTKSGRLKQLKEALRRNGVIFDNIGAVSSVLDARMSPETLAMMRQYQRGLKDFDGTMTIQQSRESDEPDIPLTKVLGSIALQNKYRHADFFEKEQIIKATAPDGSVTEIVVPAGAKIDPFVDVYRTQGGQLVDADGNVVTLGPEITFGSMPDGTTFEVDTRIARKSNGAPIILTNREMKARARKRTEIIQTAIDSAKDDGSGVRLSDIGNGNYRGVMSPSQIEAFMALPNEVVSPNLKRMTKFFNELMARNDGTRVVMEYQAALLNGKYKALSPKIRDEVPIGFQLTKDGNFALTTISVSRLYDKMQAWADKKPTNLQPWNGDTGAFWDSVVKYLDNHARGEKGETGLHPDAYIAGKMKNKINDLFNAYNAETKQSNPERSTLPRARGKDNLDIVIRSRRLDRINNFEESPSQKLPINYGYLTTNYMPAVNPMAAPMTAEEVQNRFDGSVTATRVRQAMATGEINALESELRQMDDLLPTESLQLVQGQDQIPRIQIVSMFDPENIASLEPEEIVSDIDAETEAELAILDAQDETMPPQDIAKMLSSKLEQLYVDGGRSPIIPALENELGKINQQLELQAQEQAAETIQAEQETQAPRSGGISARFMPERPTERFPTPERGFYSGLQQTIDQKVQGKFASPDQLKAIISNPQNVKAEELKWSGVLNEIDRLATENQGKVPKDKVMDYLRNEGAVKFEEATLGENTEANKIAQKYGIEIQKEYEETTFIDKDGDEVDFEDLPKELQGALSKNIPTKFGQYQLPSGENYREVVMAMPPPVNEFSRLLKKLKDKYGEDYAINRTEEEQAQLEAARDSSYDTTAGGGSVAKGIYTSSHFPNVPNYVAHMRLNERTDAEGNDGLFIEELQSDRHQAGREKGYALTESERSEIKALEDKARKEGGVVRFNAEDKARWNELGAKVEGEGIPDAPFRKDWSVQLFKRALRDAVESGKQWIGWTTGDTQAERYDLSKQIGKVVWNEDTKMLTAYDPSQKRTVIQESNITSDKLADYVGKEVAQKLVEQTPDEDMERQISGLDLKVGGEGMKGFYDQILPKEIGKYVAKMGGKVEKDAIDQSEAQYKVNKDSQPLPYRLEFSDSTEVLARFATADEAWAEAEKRSSTPIWKVNITPEMAGKVKGGQLQFMPERPTEERIVSATYTDPRTGEVREGVNHKAANPNAPDEQTDRESRYYGFKTDTGRVVDREEAYRIAEATGQLKEATSEEDKFNADRGVLHSNMVEMEPIISEKLQSSEMIGGIQFMPERKEGKKPKTAKKELEREIEPDFTHFVGAKLPTQTPEKGYFKIATNPTEDGRVIEYELDPKTTVLPNVANISSIEGEQVAMLEADRHNTRGSNMGGPLHPFLISNQAVAKLPDGRGFKPVWANMTAAFVTRAKNIINNTTSGMALIQLMKEKAHKSNRKFVQDVMSEVDSMSTSIPQERLDALHVILELGAKNPAKHLNRYKKAQKLLKDNEITQSEFNLIERFESEKIEKYKPSVDFLNALGSMKSQATKGNITAFDKAFDEHISKYKDQDWYKKIVAKYKNKTFAEEASKFTFNQRGSAMDRISGIPFIPSISQRLLESMDFNKGKNLDIVAAVQLSKDMDAFAIYTGNDPKQEAKMSATERYLRDQFLKNPQFRIHPSYDWMMLGPEDANNFILETPADPVKLFPDYASSHPKKTVREGSKETIVGTMKKSKIPLILK